MVEHRSQIAIVDDDPAVRRAVGRICGAAELPSRCFSSAEEFLSSDELDKATFLILDIQLPGLSGFELHEHLTARGIRLPVVFITGRDQPLNREKACNAGAAAYLTKPFAGAELIAALRGRMPDPGDPPSPVTNPQLQSRTP